jgi:hypothetical protein
VVVAPRSQPRLETALLGRFLDANALNPRARQAALGLELIRDGNGPRALDTLVRYRGAVFAELFRGACRAQGPPGGRPHRTPAAPAILPPPRLDQTNPRALAKTTT